MVCTVMNRSDAQILTFIHSISHTRGDIEMQTSKAHAKFNSANNNRMKYLYYVFTTIMISCNKFNHNK